MNKPEKTQDPQPEQLLKMLDMQMASARDRRIAREASRTKTGIIGIVVIIAAATIALGLLMVMLEQMRPQSGDNAGQPNIEAR